MIKIVMPVYNEGAQIYSNVVKVNEILNADKIEHGFFLVDDGSKDNSWEEMCRLAQDLPNVEVIKLSRNFGKEPALSAALELVDAQAVVVMDSDLQHPPEKIVDMVELWKQGYDIVNGVKASRGKESMIYRFFAKTYYKMFFSLTKLDLNGASDFKLLNRKALEGWRACKEATTFFRGMSEWVGFEQVDMPFHVAQRAQGETRWSIGALVRLTVNSITSYTAFPLFLVLWLGILMGIAGLIMLIQTLIVFFSGQSDVGFPTVIILQLLIGCGTMTGIAIVGLYISRIYEEVKKRPRYLVQEKRSSDQAKLEE